MQARLSGHYDPKDDYIREAFLKEDASQGYKTIKYCRLVRKTIKGKNRFYLQVVLEGLAPVKHIYASTEERLFIDPGPSNDCGIQSALGRENSSSTACPR